MQQYVLLASLLGILSGCDSAESEVVETPFWQVAVDQKSKEAFAVDGRIQLPVANPDNPKSQLQPAWYCETCNTWYPVPPLEQINRSKGATLCPKSGKQLNPEGPQPEKKLTLNMENES